MDFDKITLGELKQLQSLFGSDQKQDMQPYEIGKAYLIRSVTHIDIGIVKAVGEKEIILSDASWIADTGRYHDALKGGVSKLNEVEPYLDDVIVNRTAVIDATIWRHAVPTKQK